MKSHHLIGVGTSLLAGSLIAFVVRINASLGNAIGALESSFVAHLVGALFAIPVVLLWYRFRFAQLRSTPPHLFLGGVGGVIIVLISNVAVPHLGMVLTVGLFLVGSLFCAAIADHYGLFGLPLFRMTRRRVFGLLSALLGIALVLGGL